MCFNFLPPLENPKLECKFAAQAVKRTAGKPQGKFAALVLLDSVQLITVYFE